MEKEKVIELLRKDLDGYKLRVKTEKIEENKKHFSEKIESLEIAISELERTTLKDLRKLSEQHKKYVKQIESGILEKEGLMDEKEIEVASKILNELDGILTIRATSILKFCIKAVQYNKINI